MNKSIGHIPREAGAIPSAPSYRPKIYALSPFEMTGQCGMRDINVKPQTNAFYRPWKDLEKFHQLNQLKPQTLRQNHDG